MISGNRDEAWPPGYVPCMTNLWALYAWVIRWHVTCMLSLAEHWQGRRALSNHVCAHSGISMWHVVCLQHLARACSEQSRSTTVLPINHVIQMPQCLSGFVNHDYCDATQTQHDMPPPECIYQVSNWYLKACWRKVRKTRTDGRTDGQTDGHCHGIIRPVFQTGV